MYFDGFVCLKCVLEYSKALQLNTTQAAKVPHKIKSNANEQQQVCSYLFHQMNHYLIISVINPNRVRHHIIVNRTRGNSRSNLGKREISTR